MNAPEQLFPRPPRRMKQPTKAVLREHLALAATEIERLRTIVRGVAELARQDAAPPTTEDPS